MSRATHMLAVDQGTTSTRAIVFDAEAGIAGMAQQEYRQIYPHPGWVEHDPEDIWNTTLATVRRALRMARLEAGHIAGLGITNQRETTLIWDRESGKPIHNAIVWQDRRTADHCGRLVAEGCEDVVRQRTGLLLDPYFSATKIAWLLDSVSGGRALAEQGKLLFGTVDTYLLWRLTGGKVHATDATNASRTSLLNIYTGQWDEELLRLFRVPAAILPEVRDTAGDFGLTVAAHFGAPIPVRAMAGDQQAALIGQTCLAPGMVKATYGTGGFILLNTGRTAVGSAHRMLTTIAYQWNGTRHYALEGSIFAAGTTVQWLRDALGIFASSGEAGELAAQADPEQAVYIVPAFTGLGAPHWRSEVRGMITGLTRGATRRELARAALESVGYQTKDLLAAMWADGGAAMAAQPRPTIRVDGGMAGSDWTMQFLADLLDADVDRPTIRETTALGVALVAGWQAGIIGDPDSFASIWRLDRRFTATMTAEERSRRYAGWRDAIARVLIAPSITSA